MNRLVKKCSLIVFSLLLTSCSVSALVEINNGIVRHEDDRMVRYSKANEFICSWYMSTGTFECVQKKNHLSPWEPVAASESAKKYFELVAEFNGQ